MLRPKRFEAKDGLSVLLLTKDKRLLEAEADSRFTSVSDLARKAISNWLGRNTNESARHRLWWERQNSMPEA